MSPPVAAIPALGTKDPLEAFYVPAYTLTRLEPNDKPKKVIVQGVLKPDVLHDIESVTYTDNLDQTDTFSLTINNWDALGLKGKYFGYKKKPTGGEEADWATLFNPGQRFELELGYLGQPDHMRLMMRGYVAGIDITFPQSGAPLLKVEAQDASRKLNDETYSWRWHNKTDSEIARELAQEPNRQKGKPGLGFPVETSAEAAGKEARHPRVVMRRQKIMDFLLERAKRHAYSVFRKVDGDKEVIYFGPSEHLPDGPYGLEWGKTLLDFKPTLKVARQPKEVIVRGWDRGDRKRLERKLAVSKARFNADLADLIEPLGETKEVVDRTLRTQKQVDELADSTLATAMQSIVEATGSTIGLPDLRAGQVIRIIGVDYRLDGRYFVTQTTHTIDNSGYRTTFRARREQKAAKP